MAAIWILLLTLPGCYEEIIIDEEPGVDGHFILTLNHVEGYTDLSQSRIFFTIPNEMPEEFSPFVQYSAYNSMTFNGLSLVSDSINDFGKIEAGRSYSLVCSRPEKTDTFNVIFTTLPVMLIMTEEEIRDEPKSLATMYMQYGTNGTEDPKTYRFTSFVGIEIRGASSMKYGKVSYGIELWKDRNEEDYKTSLLDMRVNEDWIMDAMYIDDLRMRNKLSFDTWKQVATVPSNKPSEEIFPGINLRYVELLINNRYHGIYCLGEKMNEQLLDFSGDQLLEGGRIYKANDWSDGSTKFDSYHSPPGKSFFWDGWEQVYPDHDTAWDPLDQLRKFIVFSSDDDFEREIFSHFDADNLVHSFLLLNLIKGNDNEGKNNFLARYSRESGFFFIPWDMEASWGLAYNRDRVGPKGLVSNNLFDRLLATDADDFTQKIRSLWFQYREGPFSEEQLNGIIRSNYNKLTISGAYNREAATWTEFEIDPAAEYDAISMWLRSRLEYLDEFYSELE